MPRRKELNPNIVDLSQSVNIKLLRDSIKGAFCDIPDPRESNRVIYPLWYLLLIIVAGYLSGCDTIADLEAFGRLRHAWLNKLTDTIHQAPSYDTLWMLLARLTPDGLKALIQKWMSSIPDDLKDQVLAIDGKRARGATYLGNTVHLVELIVTDTGLTLTQERVPAKHNEKAALEPILSAVDVRGAIITMDALYTTPSTAQLVQSRGADYILALKGNQGNVHGEAQNFFKQARAVKPEEAGVEVWHEIREGHGRKESVMVTVCQDIDWLPQRHEWTGLSSLVEVVTTDESTGSSRPPSTRYYLSSSEGKAKEFANWIRSHWKIENSVHWVADVVFREDASKASVGHLQENMALIRRLVMNIVRSVSPGMGVAEARRTCCFSESYLTGLLAKVFVKSL